MAKMIVKFTRPTLVLMPKTKNNSKVLSANKDLFKSKGITTRSGILRSPNGKRNMFLRDAKKRTTKKARKN